MPLFSDLLEIAAAVGSCSINWKKTPSEISTHYLTECRMCFELVINTWYVFSPSHNTCTREPELVMTVVSNLPLIVSNNITLDFANLEV